MRFLYYIRVIFVSFEFLVLVCAFGFYYFGGAHIESFLEYSSLNGDAVQWIVFYPVGVAAWVLKEGGGVLFPSEDSNAILHEWPGYWRLRVHFNVGFFYCVWFAVPGVLLWVFNSILTAGGLAIFVASILASSISALSFYQANLRLRELLLGVK